MDLGDILHKCRRLRFIQQVDRHATVNGKSFCLGQLQRLIDSQSPESLRGRTSARSPTDRFRYQNL